MNRDPLALLMPLVALAILALVLVNTMGALRSAGAFASAEPRATSPLPDPYAQIDLRLEEIGAVAGTVARDPFGLAVAAPPPPDSTRVRPRPTTPRPPVVPPPAPRPTLTAIVFDDDPRALLLWDGRQYTVRAGSLFDDFRVASISRDRVVLERGGETIVLNRPQGE